MTPSPRPAPVVRVSDPRALRTDVHAAPSPEPAAPPPPADRRRALPLALLLVGLVVGAGGSELRHAQADRAADTAAAGVLDLRLEGAQAYSSSAEAAAGRVVLRRDLDVRNVGGRPVRVVSAQLVGGGGPGAGGGAEGGTMLSLGSGRVLAHGDAWQVAMTGPVTCPGGPPSYAPAGSVLRVRAETGAGERTTDLPVPAPVLQELQTTAERACGVVPVEEAVQAEPGNVVIGEESATVDVQVHLHSSAPVDLLRIEPGSAGLRVAVRAGGRPPVFPFRLFGAGTWPRLDGGELESSSLQVVVSVADCAPFRDAGPTATPVGAGPLLQLWLRVGGDEHQVLREVYDPGVVAPLVEQAC